jgi:cyclophilin family peptidyl-prolyl cis-trans isomerase/HEAT repeat protein
MFPRGFVILIVSGFLLAAGCASAPPVKAPVVPPEQKLADIIRLEDQRILREVPPPPPAPPPGRKQKARVPPPPPTPDLIPLLSDPDVVVRRRAALAVGRVALPEGVAPLLPLLKDPDPDVRQMAAFALGLIGDRTASPSLQALLTDTSYIVRGRAAEALGLVGDAASAAAIAAMVKDAAAQGHVDAVEPDLERYPMEPPLEAFRLGVYALVRLKAYDALASAVLDGARPITPWWPVAYALSRIEDARAVPALTSLLAGNGTYSRAFAARGLGVTKAEGAVDALIGQIEPGRLNPLIAVSAIRALAQIGDARAGGALMALLSAPNIDPAVRLEGVVALGTLKAPGAADVLMDLAGDAWPSMRAAALRALAETDPNAFVFALSGLDPDAHWSVRAALAGALANLPAEVAEPRLTSMLSDTDRRVIPAVLSAMVRAKLPSAEAALRKHLDDPDVVIRMTAARELGALKPADGPRVFADAYARWSADNTYLARAAALTALAQYGPAAADPLRTALKDREWAIRVKALDLLKGVDPNAADPHAIRPAPSRPPVPYAAPEVVAPPYSPHLYVETSKGLIEIELTVRDAPLTAQTIMALARKGFFTGVAFHRVVPNFVVQTGDPRGDGEGGPNFTIRDELNELPYLRGTVGMALDWRDTGGSQFFITHSPQPHLDARYTVFGRVVKGMEVVDQLRQWDTIESVRVWDGATLTGGYRELVIGESGNRTIGNR